LNGTPTFWNYQIKMSNPNFIPPTPTVEDCWRGIILYGKNSATYKFALAESLLKLRPKSGQLVKLEDLAPIYGQAIAAHIVDTPEQGTNPGKFLESIKAYNLDKNLDALVKATVSNGFNNVIDAFHIVSSGAVAHQYFVDERKIHRGIRITDEFSKLVEGMQISNITQEVDSRWRLVETAWKQRISPSLLVINHDPELNEMFVVDGSLRRKAITSSRGALNGYQKGHCFYCGKDLQILGQSINTDVDHFFPHNRKKEIPTINLDGVWNLVLSCIECNRGADGKFDRIPSVRLLERLQKRNDFLISSHHPLRETIINQTGDTPAKRADFLRSLYSKFQLNTGWEPKNPILDPF
jgi:5-methylcytosine-specific restriction endonuclease McrA